MYFLLADRESKFIIFAICSSCFTSFCSQDQILEIEFMDTLPMSRITEILNSNGLLLCLPEFRYFKKTGS